MIVSFLGGLSIISTHVGIRVLHNLKVLIVVTSLICLDTGRIMHVQSLTPEGLFSCLRLAHSSLIGLGTQSWSFRQQDRCSVLSSDELLKLKIFPYS